MLPLVRVSLGLLLLVIFTASHHGSMSTGGVFARSVVKRALPQFMEYDQSSYQQPPQRTEHRSNIVKIHPKKSARSNDPVLSDVTNFRGIGEGHNAFGGPTYAGEYYPLARDRAREHNFSFGDLLSDLALWNLAHGFNMYSQQDKVQTAPNVGHPVSSSEGDSQRNKNDVSERSS